MSKKKQLPGLITGLVAMLAVACFFVLGYLTGRWEIVWLVFLAIPIAAIITDIVMKERDIHGAITGFVALLAGIAYAILGFTLNLWHPGWLVFLAVPLAGTITDIAKKRNHGENGLTGVIAIVAVITFLILGFFADLWHVAWIVFLLIPISAIIANIIKAAKAEMGSGSDSRDVDQ